MSWSEEIHMSTEAQESRVKSLESRGDVLAPKSETSSQS